MAMAEAPAVSSNVSSSSTLEPHDQPTPSTSNPETTTASLSQPPPSSASAAAAPAPAPLSKNAQKKLLKQRRYELKKAEKKAQAKDQRNKDKERKRQEWEEKLATMSEEEKAKVLESRKEVRKERMGKRAEERGRKVERLKVAREKGQNVVLDLDFGHLMTAAEINSLVQQIIYCYAVNSKCDFPSHLWLTGYKEDLGDKLSKVPGFDNWIIEKETMPYGEALQDKKEHLVYLTADAETVLEDLDPQKIYIIGGLVDRNRHKGLTLKKAQEQGIQAAKLPIGSYLKMSSSQVLTVNQVLEILLKYMETRDWKASFFQVIPQRKRSEGEADGNGAEGEEEDGTENKVDLLGSQKKVKISGEEVDGLENDSNENDTSNRTKM